MLESLRRKLSLRRRLVYKDSYHQQHLRDKSKAKKRKGKKGSLLPSSSQPISSDNYPEDSFTVCISVFSSEDDHYDHDSDRSTATTSTSLSGSHTKRVRNFPVYVDMAGIKTYRPTVVVKEEIKHKKPLPRKPPVVVDPWDAFVKTRSKSILWDDTTNSNRRRAVRSAVKRDHKYDAFYLYEDVGELPSLRRVTSVQEVGELPPLTISKAAKEHFQKHHHDDVEEYKDVGELPKLIKRSQQKGNNVALPFSSGSNQEVILMDASCWNKSAYSTIKVKTPLSSDPDEQEVIWEDSNPGIKVTVPLSTDEVVIRDPECPLTLIEEGDEGAVETTLNYNGAGYPWDEDDEQEPSTPPKTKKKRVSFVNDFTATVDGIRYDISYLL